MSAAIVDVAILLQLDAIDIAYIVFAGAKTGPRFAPVIDRFTVAQVEHALLVLRVMRKR